MVTLQYGRLIFAHGESKGREHVSHKIQEQNLQGQEWQRESGEDRKPHDHHLAQVARQQIGRETAYVAKDDTALADRGRPSDR